MRDIKWWEVRVGMVLEVRDGEDFPADLVCLHCATPNHVCYVKTTNLDGAAQASAWTFTAVLHVKVPLRSVYKPGKGSVMPRRLLQLLTASFSKLC